MLKKKLSSFLRIPIFIPTLQNRPAISGADGVGRDSAPKGQEKHEPLRLIARVGSILMFISAFFISLLGSSRIYCNDAEMQKQELVPVYRLWNEKTKDHMVTASLEEKDRLQNSLKWNYEGKEGYIYKTQQPNTAPLNRYYNGTTKDHYCTSNEEFKKAAFKSGYHYETTLGYIYKIQQPNTVPFYQFYSEVRQDHFITSDADFFKFARQFGGYENKGIEGYIVEKSRSKEKLK